MILSPCPGVIVCPSISPSSSHVKCSLPSQGDTNQPEEQLLGKPFMSGGGNLSTSKAALVWGPFLEECCTCLSGTGQAGMPSVPSIAPRCTALYICYAQAALTLSTIQLHKQSALLHLQCD